jgi:hypothetical protein
MTALALPGLPNWLETGGRRQGTAFWRFLAATEQPEPIRSQVPTWPI